MKENTEEQANILSGVKWKARRICARILLHIFVFQQQTIRIVTKLVTPFGYLPATLASLSLCAAISIFKPFVLIDNGDQFHLTCAGILGGAMALVMSLSIIPAQKAAEAFSTAILRLYAKDRALLVIFIILTGGTLLSLYLGLKVAGTSEGVGPILVQLGVLGFAFDALRNFYKRTLELLIPETALASVRAECSRLIRITSRKTEQIAKIQKLAGVAARNLPPLRATAFAQSKLASVLNFWIAQLDEFSHKAVARRDTLAANAIITGVAEIAVEYAEARRTSLVIFPDFAFPLAGGQNDVSIVLSKVHESIRALCEDAAEHKNELVVDRCLTALAEIALRCLRITYEPEGMHKSAPLAYDPIFYLKLCVETAIRAKMQDAILSATRSLNTVVLATSPGTNVDTMVSTAIEAYFAIAVAGYREPVVVTSLPAIEGLMLAARHDIEKRGYGSLPVLETCLRHVELLVPFEIVTESVQPHRMQVIAPYDMSSECNLANLLQQVANRIEPDENRPWVNPLDEFCEAARDITQHFRKLGAVPFGKSLLRKWVTGVALECVEVLVRVFKRPPAGAESFTEVVRDEIKWMLCSISFLFPNKSPFGDRHAAEAAGSLAFIAMSFLKDGDVEMADECASIISSLCQNCAQATTDAYAYADIAEYLEMLALAADSLNLPVIASRYRKLIGNPKLVPADRIVDYLESCARRISQMRERIERFNGSFRRRDPDAMFHEILKGGDLPQEDEDCKALLVAWETQ